MWVSHNYSDTTSSMTRVLTPTSFTWGFFGLTAVISPLASDRSPFLFPWYNTEPCTNKQKQWRNQWHIFTDKTPLTLRRKVSLESLYGMCCERPWAILTNDIITLPSTDNDWLIFPASCQETKRCPLKDRNKMYTPTDPLKDKSLKKKKRWVLCTFVLVFSMR